MKSNKVRGTFSASTPGAFIRQNTVGSSFVQQSVVFGFGMFILYRYTIDSLGKMWSSLFTARTPHIPVTFNTKQVFFHPLPIPHLWCKSKIHQNKSRYYTRSGSLNKCQSLALPSNPANLLMEYEKSMNVNELIIEVM